MDKEHYSSLLRAYADPIEDPGLIPAPTLLEIAKHIDELEANLAFSKKTAIKSYTACSNYQSRIKELEEESNTKVICDVLSCPYNKKGICKHTTIRLQGCSPVADNFVACTEFCEL